MLSDGAGHASVAPAEGESPAFAAERERRYDLLDAAVLDNPYPLYDELRTAAPVYRDRRFFGCILTRYDDIVARTAASRRGGRRPTNECPITCRHWRTAPRASGISESLDALS